jgi:hypothetical protein
VKRENLRRLLLAELCRVAELIEEIPAKNINCQCYDDYSAQKAELKIKMHELRRDTVRMDKMLKEYMK